jgi:thioredoxin reductase (NADPH)
MPGFPRLAESYDLVIVGGGHAGLQAGLKAALLNHTSAILDRGPKYGRSYYSPRMDNIPGFPDGISGHKLLDLQIASVHAVADRTGYFTPATATSAQRIEGGFEVAFDWLKQPRTVRGRALVLAMGVVDRMPLVAGKIDPIFPWANFGIVDFCIFCDGHTLPGKSVGVLGADAFAVRTALDLLHFGPSSLELLTNGDHLLADAPEGERAELQPKLAAAGIGVVEAEITGFDEIREKRFGVHFADGTVRSFDKGFSALGWYDQHAALPVSLGAAIDGEGFVRTDSDSRVLDLQGAPIPGLYCVGDLGTGWNQIPEAWAQAERAVIHAYADYL